MVVPSHRRGDGLTPRRSRANNIRTHNLPAPRRLGETAIPFPLASASGWCRADPRLSILKPFNSPLGFRVDT